MPIHPAPDDAAPEEPEPPDPEPGHPEPPDPEPGHPEPGHPEPDHPTSRDAARLDVLDSYQILDSDPDESFEFLCRLAAGVCGSPYAMINLLDDHRQWSLASFGGLRREQPREGSFCTDIVSAGMPLVVPATAEDERYAGRTLVASAPWIQSYAGVPLTVRGDVVLGAICVLDVRSRPFDAAQLATLHGLADQVSALLELRRLRLLLLLLAPLVGPDAGGAAAAGGGGLDARGVWALQQLIQTGAEVGGGAPGPHPVLSAVPGLSGLTNRELDIVARLLAGDRVPVIAERLFLSQSTVRNHLSSAFAKLGVESQQEVIDLLRRTSSSLFRRQSADTT